MRSGKLIFTTVRGGGRGVWKDLWAGLSAPGHLSFVNVSQRSVSRDTESVGVA